MRLHQHGDSTKILMIDGSAQKLGAKIQKTEIQHETTGNEKVKVDVASLLAQPPALVTEGKQRAR